MSILPYYSISRKLTSLHIQILAADTMVYNYIKSHTLHYILIFVTLFANGLRLFTFNVEFV